MALDFGLGIGFQRPVSESGHHAELGHHEAQRKHETFLQEEAYTTILPLAWEKESFVPGLLDSPRRAADSGQVADKARARRLSAGGLT